MELIISIILGGISLYLIYKNDQLVDKNCVIKLLAVNEISRGFKLRIKNEQLIYKLAFAGKNYIEKTNSLKDKIQIQADNIVELKKKCRRYALRIKKLKN